MPPLSDRIKKLEGRELKRILVLMGPLYLANLMSVGMGVIDTMVAGSAGTRDLAAVALGTSVTVPVMVSVGAVLNIISPMLARLLGAGHERRAGLLLNSAKLLSLALMLVEFVLLYLGSYVFPYITNSPQLAQDAALYVYFLVGAVPASLLMRVVQGCWEGYAQTRPAMVVCLLGLVLNVPLNYACVLGWWGFPALGGAGCGLATTIVHWLMCAVLLGMQIASRRHRWAALQMLGFRRFGKIGVMRRIVRLGLPLGVASLCEMSYFCVITLVIAPLGELMVSAQQIAINISSVLFMFPLSLSIAVSIRGAYLVGARSERRFRALVRAAMRFMYAATVFLMSAVIYWRHSIISLYTDDPTVTATAATLVTLCAVYQFSDGTQALMTGLLRACHDTAVITWANIGCYWALGFPLSVVLIRTDWLLPAMGPEGAWWSFIISLTAIAVIFALRFRATARKVFLRS